jgi:predicted O-linked N-acetylglucosamine transferase (SPINDLY family)
MFQTAVQFIQVGKFQDAEAVLLRIVAGAPRDFDAVHMLGIVCSELGKAQEAENYFSFAYSIDQSHPPLYQNWGLFLHAQRRFGEAVDKFSAGINLASNYPPLYNDRGNALRALGEFDKSLNDFNRAIALAPNFFGFYNNRGNLFRDRGEHQKALQDFSKVLSLNPDFDFIKGRYLHQKMLCCDWSGVKFLIEDVAAGIAAGKPAADPFSWQGLSRSELSLQQCARTYNKARFPPQRAGAGRSARAHGGKIRIGYLSGEFREQATSLLIVGLLENHDKSKFELFAFDNGWDDGSAIRKRINGAVHKVVDIRRLDDASAANRVADEGIDILVNLNGYFGEERTRVFACKAAPIQVNYLGFPGTLGAPYIDYIIADRIVIPPSSTVFYDEKIARLPHSYQPNDRGRQIDDRPVSRAEFGLPEGGLVFCCFNNCYKITPEVFASWMNILRRVETGVLWLLQDIDVAAENLRNSARQSGVDPGRIVFAGRASPAAHLARHRLADLFLDTLPYNAHTTASDALWAGVPVLTRIGGTFAGRVGASLLNAIGLPELVTHSAEEYEALAVELARHPEKLRAIRAKLAEDRLTAPLFDTQLYTRHIETAYEAMHRRRQAGLPPDHIEISDG